MKLCLVGGHLTPALALAQEALTHHDQLIFIGREYTSSLGIRSQEARQLHALKGKFYPINSPKINTHQLTSLIKLPLILPTISKIRRLLQSQSPQLVVTFGSYLAFPVALAAKTLGLPLVIHEQTTVPGLTNRILAPLADRILVAWPGTQAYFPEKKTSLVGNPIRPEFMDQTLPRPSWLPGSALPLLYITGGNQGSEVINQTLQLLYPKLLNRFQIVHQCGGFGTHRAQTIADGFRHPRLFVREWLESAETAWCMGHASVIVARAGANTISEIIFVTKPSVLIPLPQSRFGEQLENAKLITASGGGYLLTQSLLTPDRLLSEINRAEANKSELINHLVTLRQSLPQPTASLLYQQLIQVLG